jgi:hypothetical protein
MLQSQLAATRRHIAVFVGATLAISGLVIWGARQLSPERTVDTQAAASTETVPSEPSVILSASRVLEPAPAPLPPAAPPRDDEGSLMSELRAVKERDPKRALELAREGNRRFPNSEAAAERASIAIHALTALGQTSEARGEAEDMVNRYPDNEWVREIERFTGAHRHRNVRVNAEGKLEYYDSAPNTD